MVARGKLWIGLVLVVLTSATTSAQLVAERVTADNAARRLFSGSDAIGGVGDWYLSNGVIEAIVDAAGFNSDLLARGIPVPNQFLLSPTGGTLVDLALVGANNDQLTQLFSVVNISPQNSLFYTIVRAETAADAATIIADGFVIMEPFSNATKPTLALRTTYSAARGAPFLDILTTITNGGSTVVPLFNVTDAVPVVGSIIPFAPFPGRGFNHPPLVLTPEGITAILGVYPYVVLPGQLSPANGVIDTVTNAKAGEVAYGIVPLFIVIDPDDAGPLPPVRTPVPALLGLTTHTVIGVGNAFDPTRSPMIPAGGSFTYARRVIVTDRNDVASVTNAVYASLGQQGVPIGTITGDVDAEGAADVQASILVSGKLTALFGDITVPITQVKTDSAGKFALVLPQGDYTLTISSPERSDLTVPAVRVAAGTTPITMPKLSATGSVAYRVTEGGSLVPARLTFIGVGNPNPDFSRNITSSVIDPKTFAPIADRQVSAAVGAPALNYVITSEGSGQQTIRPGRYRVIASRGIEYTADMKQIDVTAGNEVRVDFALRRVVDTTGWASADFHIHSARSFDSSIPLEDRVRSYVADGIELLVSTDHNFITDFAPTIALLKLGSWARSIVGNELTTFLPTPQFPQAFGHHNVFPVVVEPTAPRRGAVFTEYVNAATMYDRSRLKNPEIRKVLQLNHPRAGVLGFTSIGLFNVIRFDPTAPIPVSLLDKSFLGTNTTNLDFDAIEIYNGNSLGAFLQVRNDWFSLLDQGVTKTATAVTDSHRVVVEMAGFPRSYVATSTDDPSRITDAMLTDAVVSRQLIGTSGPFIRFSIDGKGMGSLVHPRNWLGSRMEIVVSAPAWVPVAEVRVYANGRLMRKFDASTMSADGERFRTTLRISPVRDTYYTVEAGIPLPDAVDTNGDGVVDTTDSNGDGVVDNRDRGMPQPVVGGLYGDIAPGFVPLAFTNPIFLDRNGDGRFNAPGIDSGRVRRLPLPLRTAPETDAALEHSSALLMWSQLRITSDDVSRFWARQR